MESQTIATPAPDGGRCRVSFWTIVQSPESIPVQSASQPFKVEEESDPKRPAGRQARNGSVGRKAIHPYHDQLSLVEMRAFGGASLRGATSHPFHQSRAH